MCGITGFVAPTQPNPQILNAMNATLVHRGPDDAGTWHDQHVALGHRRLAIIDLHTGDQPLANADQTWWIVFNGEIYNFQALRHELMTLGCRFQTNSDTEVIVNALEHWGEQALDRFNGMFAFAAWHIPTQRLWLVRDRVGKKPLYYSVCADGTLVFGSELKAVLAHPSVDHELNSDALGLYLTYGYVPAPQTWYAAIQQLPPANALVWQNGSIRQWQWWNARDYAQRERLNISEHDAIAETRRLVREAVQRRLISDVPLGAFLSGGIDSSIIVAEMQKLMQEPVHTFSIGFRGDAWYDESDYARQVAQHLGTLHHEFMVAPDAVQLIEELIDHYDEPFLDSSALPTYLLSKMTREHVTVALSGDGGDEVFAGYERFGMGMWTNRYQRMPSIMRRMIESTIDNLPATNAKQRIAQVQRVMAKMKLPLAESFPRWLMAWNPEEQAILIPTLSRHSAAERFEQLTHGIRDPLAALLTYNLLTYLPDDLLVKTDRMSMAHGLEVRAPFLDVNMIEWCLQLPAHLLWRGRRGKWLLRHAYADVLPNAILNRPKHGFGVPLDAWFRNELKPMLGDLLGHNNALVKQWLNPNMLDQLCRDHWSERSNAGHQLWMVLTLELWLRQTQKQVIA